MLESVHRLLHPSQRDVALALALLPGLVCVLGLGHLYLGFRRRAGGLIAVSGVLLLGFVVALTPYGVNPSVSLVISPILFPIVGLGACLLAFYDVHRLTRSTTRSESPGRVPSGRREPGSP